MCLNFLKLLGGASWPPEQWNEIKDRIVQNERLSEHKYWHQVLFYSSLLSFTERLWGAVILFLCFRNVKFVVKWEQALDVQCVHVDSVSILNVDWKMACSLNF